MGRREARAGGAARLSLLRSRATRVRGGARHAERPLSVRPVRRAAAATGVGPGGGQGARPGGRAATGGGPPRERFPPRALSRGTVWGRGGGAGGGGGGRFWG